MYNLNILETVTNKKKRLIIYLKIETIDYLSVLFIKKNYSQYEEEK